MSWLATGSASRNRWTGGRRWPSWPAATWFGHQPASDRDLARWAGLPLRDARAGLAAISSKLEEDGDLVRLAKRPDPEEIPSPRLLGAFDPVLLGWTSREDILGPHTSLVTRNGIFYPFAMVKGRAVAKWGLAAGKLTVEPPQALPATVARALEADAAAVTRFLAAHSAG